MLLPCTNTGSLGSSTSVCVIQQMELLSSVCREMYQQLESFNLWALFYQLEMRILPALVTMERHGVNVDRVKMETIGLDLNTKMTELQAQAVKEAGRKFNLSSPKQVREILFDELKLDQIARIEVSKTGGGVKTTCESILMKLTPHHPLPGLVLQHRQMAKYKSTYVEGILAHAGNGGKVATSWDQIAAATGRVTSVSPNIQVSFGSVSSSKLLLMFLGYS